MAPQARHLVLQIKLDRNTLTPIHLPTGCGCFCITRAESSSWDLKSLLLPAVRQVCPPLLWNPGGVSHASRIATQPPQDRTFYEASTGHLSRLPSPLLPAPNMGCHVVSLTKKGRMLRRLIWSSPSKPTQAVTVIFTSIPWITTSPKTPGFQNFASQPTAALQYPLPLRPPEHSTKASLVFITEADKAGLFHALSRSRTAQKGDAGPACLAWTLRTGCWHCSLCRRFSVQCL